MSEFFEKIKDFFLADETEDIETPDFSEQEEYDARPVLRIAPKRTTELHEEYETPIASNLVQMPMYAKPRIVDYRPHSFEDMASVVSALRAGKTVVLHLDKIDPDIAQRSLDFASGVIYAYGCTSTMATDHICIIVPRSSVKELHA